MILAWFTYFINWFMYSIIWVYVQYDLGLCTVKSWFMYNIIWVYHMSPVQFDGDDNDTTDLIVLTAEFMYSINWVFVH